MQSQLKPSCALQTANGGDSSQVVQQVIDSQVEQLLSSQTIQQYNDSYTDKHGSTSLRHTAAAAEMLLLLQPQETQRAIKLLLDSQSISEQPGRCHIAWQLVLHGLNCDGATTVSDMVMPA